MNPKEKMKSLSHTFTKTDERIYNYIIENPTQFVHRNIYELAKLTGISRSAILRFSQKLGYSGFSEFKYDYSRYVHSGISSKTEHTQSTISEIVDIYQKTINYMKESLDENKLNQLVEKMVSARKIKIFGINRTGHSAMQLRQRLHKIAVDGEAVIDFILIPEIASQGKPEDVHIYFSTLGETETIMEAVKLSHASGAYTVLITMNEQSKMIAFTDLYLLLPSTKMFSRDYFFDLQPINMVFIEVLISYLGLKLQDAL